MKQKYYDLLGINEDSTIEDIKKAHRKKSMEYHPDRNFGFQKEAEKKMKEINEARDFLIKNYGYSNEKQSSNNKESKDNKESNSGYKNNSKNKEDNLKQDRVRNRLGKVCHIIIYGLIIGGSLSAFFVGLNEGDEDLVIGALVSLFGLVLLYKLILTTVEYIFMGKFNFTFKNEISIIKKCYQKIIQHNLFKIFVQKISKILKSFMYIFGIPIIILILIGFFLGIYNSFKLGNYIYGKNLEENNVLVENDTELIGSKSSVLYTTESKGEPEYQNSVDYYEREMLQNTNFRISTNTSSDIIAVIEKGTSINMSGFFYENIEGKWYEIDYMVGGILETGYINEIAFKSDGELKMDKITLQNTNYRLYPTTSSSVIKVIPKGTTVNVYNEPYENNEGFWYSLDYYISGELKNGYVNDIAFKTDSELGINAEKEDENETIIYIDPNKIYFDCGIGGTYSDILGACSCNRGYGKGNNGKCEARDCGIGGTYSDILEACSCNRGYGKLSDGKCYK